MFGKAGSPEAVYTANTRTLPSSRVLANLRGRKESRVRLLPIASTALPTAHDKHHRTGNRYLCAFFTRFRNE